MDIQEYNLTILKKQEDYTTMSKIIHVAGEKFGRWEIIEEAGRNKHGVVLWKCKCECGTIRNVPGNALRTGNSTSCGCINAEFLHNLAFKHGFSKTDLSSVYSNMRQRCYNNKHPKFLTYGARGIKICKEWLTNPTSFYNWAINSGYKKGLTLDRIDNNNNYKPDNCRWVTKKTQQNNMRTNRIITYGNKTQSLSQWATDLGLHPTSLSHRLQSGWTEEEAVSIPRGGKRKLGMIVTWERPRDERGRFSAILDKDLCIDKVK
jgi:hypothetical protein